MSNPTDDLDWSAGENQVSNGVDDWEDFSDSQSSPVDDWEIGDGSQGTNNTSTDAWSDWESPSQSDNTQFVNQQSGVANNQFVNQQAGGANNQFVNQQNNTQFMNQQANQFVNQQQDSVNNFQQPDDFDNPVQEGGVLPRVGHKSAALLVAGACIIVALVLYFINNIHISSNRGNAEQVQTQIQQEEQQIEQNQAQQNQGQVQEQEQGQSQESLDTSGKVVLVEIPNKTDMEYSDDSFQANGTITDKKKYVMGGQIVYCLQINVSLPSSDVSVSHFCNSSTFDSVDIDSMVSVTYQVVNNDYISVSAISN